MTSEENNTLGNNEIPNILNVREISSCFLSADWHRHGFLDVVDIRNHMYRIKEKALKHILRGDFSDYYVVPKYGRYYLEITPPKRNSRNRNNY
jgi:hypothetical protein